MRAKSIVGVVAVLVFVGSIQTPGAGAAQWPVIGVSRQVVEHAWSHDIGVGAHCAGNGAMCTYRYGRFHLSVGFDRHGKVEDFEVDPYPGESYRGVNVWGFLRSLVPRSARQKSCRNMATSDEYVPAHACLYRWTKTWDILIAQYIHSESSGIKGKVLLPIEGYKDIAR